MDAFESSFITSDELPLVLKPKNPNLTFQDFLNLLKENNAELKQKMLKYGGFLFRDFPVKDIDDFSSVIDTMQIGERLDYIGGDSPRSKIKKKVYTSTEASPSFKIPLHNEMSFQNKYPTHISFFCDTPPAEDGETIIGDARKIYQAMDPDVRDLFEKKGLKYISRYYHKSRIMDFVNRLQRGHKSWIESFDTESKKEVEQKCQVNEYGFEWLDKDWLQINRDRPATIEHPETKEKVWFNQVHTFDFNPKFLGFWRYIGATLFYCRKNTRVNDVCFGDGTKIPRKAIYHVLDVLDQQTLKFPWEKGDVLVLDNILAMHGRSTFKGDRRILTAMTKA